MFRFVPCRLAAAGLAAIVLVLPACGDDEEEASPSGESGGSTTSTVSGAALACEPVGDGSGTSIPVTLKEWTVVAEPATAPTGKVTFRARNDGSENHELVVVKGEDPAGLPIKDGKVAEDDLPEGAFIGEIEGFSAGATCPGTFDLAAGKYVLFCNIVEEEEDGTLESHYQEGMHTAFTVS